MRADERSVNNTRMAFLNMDSIVRLVGVAISFEGMRFEMPFEKCRLRESLVAVRTGKVSFSMNVSFMGFQITIRTECLIASGANQIELAMNGPDVSVQSALHFEAGIAMVA